MSWVQARLPADRPSLPADQENVVAVHFFPPSLPPPSANMGYGAPKLLFVAALAVNCVIWSHSRYGQVYSVRAPSELLAKRSLPGVDYMNGTLVTVPAEDEDGDVGLPFHAARVRY